ncbi:peptidase M48 Ste24p [Scytonema sp. HK-05]|uniref:M48 family metalloprotease n=1 Tax=Scytonema sp. HK-05 TaxID=1137095 RepID=UPI0009367102|nr:M48 family metalloprotease [Scytonema sp. HK-05]OKH60188.1 peptidase M48 Ste24p [Scytonema sp. HK-05]BAY42842.1 peptidase M48 Ste24p [Scytonema sp. HK-05]
MQRKWKPLLLAFSWVLLSVGTSILIILTQPIISPAKEPPASTTHNEPLIVPTEEKSPSATPNPEASNTKKPTESKQPTSSDNNKKPESAAEPPPSPEEIARQQKLIEADKLYQAGQIAAAEKLYREVKEPFAKTPDTQQLKEPIVDLAQLSPGGQVYWREAEAGIASQMQTRTLVALELLVEKNPEFIPGHIRYAEVLKEYGEEKKALQVLDNAATLYPNQPDLIKTRVAALSKAKKWMEASLAARQFALLNPNDPQAPEFTKLAEDNLKRYKSHIRGKIRGNAIANIITGVLGYAVTGSLLGPFTALDSTIMMLRGEGSIGESVAKQAKKQLKLVKDEAVLGYVDEIGQKLAKVSGRNEFKYEFFVIPEADLNAFALPGGKIFINAGAIAKSNSEAELAGLIGHELSHVVLSHGFQLVTQGNLIANVTQYVPYGGIVGQLFALSYSRDMERQADTLGTRLITATGYAADGLRNLMVTLEKQQKFTPPSWLSSHPGGNERVRSLEELISRNKYNRYAYEGVARHSEIQAKAKQILKEEKERKDKKGRRR